MEKKENTVYVFVCKECGSSALMSIEETSGNSKVYLYPKEGPWDINYADYEPYYSEVVGYICHDCFTQYTEEEIKQLEVKEVSI
tara:strand:- start:714 stop:965 length:252 start_codon:yes stop_codon:yes gene_type:complete